jgi:hypothetical protein
LSEEDKKAKGKAMKEFVQNLEDHFDMSNDDENDGDKDDGGNSVLEPMEAVILEEMSRESQSQEAIDEMAKAAIRKSLGWNGDGDDDVSIPGAGMSFKSLSSSASGSAVGSASGVFTGRSHRSPRHHPRHHPRPVPHLHPRRRHSGEFELGDGRRRHKKNADGNSDNDHDNFVDIGTAVLSDEKLMSVMDSDSEEEAEDDGDGDNGDGGEVLQLQESPFSHNFLGRQGQRQRQRQRRDSGVSWSAVHPRSHGSKGNDSLPEFSENIFREGMIHKDEDESEEVSLDTDEAHRIGALTRNTAANSGSGRQVTATSNATDV